ncbi:MAG: NAD-dependent epimerase/dehydratase family protein [Chthoniobacterales bacterium]|nr:NAD-dependent epimerase/dehydratase family protein [Chthoniobacterales bacterium]
MKALVTGGAGFIGSHVADALLAAGWKVVILDNLATGSEANIPDGADFLRGDVGDAGLLAPILPGCQAVFHLAAVSSVQDSLARPVKVHETNLTATLSLLEETVRHQVPRFIFSSSAAVYGDTGGQPAREDMKPCPLSHYAVQKLACEHYCSVYHRLHGLETVCLRYFNVFGPRQRADSPYSGVIAKFLDAAKAGRPVTIFGDGGQTRDFCHVSDVVAANLTAATAPATRAAGRVFNIGSGTSRSVNQIAAAVQACFPASAAPEQSAGRSGEVRTSCADISQAAAGLNFHPNVGFEEGLENLAKLSR